MLICLWSMWRATQRDTALTEPIPQKIVQMPPNLCSQCLEEKPLLSLQFWREKSFNNHYVRYFADWRWSQSGTLWNWYRWWKPFSDIRQLEQAASSYCWQWKNLEDSNCRILAGQLDFALFENSCSDCLKFKSCKFLCNRNCRIHPTMCWTFCS